jgi:hypothetical protein
MIAHGKWIVLSVKVGSIQIKRRETSVRTAPVVTLSKTKVSPLINMMISKIVQCVKLEHLIQPKDPHRTVRCVLGVGIPIKQKVLVAKIVLVVTHSKTKVPPINMII